MNRAQIKQFMKNLLNLTIGSLLFVTILLLTISCRQKPVMDKARAEKAIRVCDSEVVGTVAGITQTDGWQVFSGLLKSDSNLVNLTSADSILSSVFLKIPFDFNREFSKNGQKVCAVRHYYKMNQDSSFYLYKEIFIRPLTIGMNCLYTPSKLHKTGRLNLIISTTDSTGKFMEARIRVLIKTQSKGEMNIDAIQAEIKLFDLVFSINSDFSRLNSGSRKTWSDYLQNQHIEVSDYSSREYIGCFESEEKDSTKRTEFFFIFADGSKEPAAKHFSSLGLLKSQE